MNKNSRIKNSTYNFISNVAFQFVNIITAFAIRRVFINTLGVEFLGIAGLFNNILAVLSLAELGVGSAISYSMYKAIADSDKDKLAALNIFYKSIYNKIAIFVLIAGLSLLPFLQFIVKLDRVIPHLYYYYILEVINSVLSYLFIYKTAIVNADQSGYKLNKVSIALQFLKFVLQIIALVVFKKYMLYILVGIGTTIFGNIIKSLYAEKWYPFIKDKTKELLPEEKNKIWNNIKAMFLYKVGGVVLNNTDNILISVIINTTVVGMYSNYTMIYNKINAIISIAFSAINSSLGNYNAKATTEEKYSFYKIIDFLSYILYSYFAIGVFFCGEDFIRAITGSNLFVLDKSILIITIIYFYLNMLKKSVSMYRETTGLFNYGKYSFIISAVLNICLSIILGKIWGLAGILSATIIARLLSDIWYEPYVLYNKIFNRKSREYFIEQIWRAMIVILIVFLIVPLYRLNSIQHLYFRMGLNGCICVTITSLMFYVVFSKSKEFNYIFNKIISAFKSK